MIFVTLGTQDKSFTRLLEGIEKEIDKKNIKEKVIVQAGYTKYDSKKMEIYDYIPQDDFENYMKKADIIITHGGVGSILSALKMKKKIIAVPREEKYKEHENNHQLQIVEEFENKGYLIKVTDMKELKSAIEKAKKFNPKEYHSNNKKFMEKLEKELKEKHISWWNRYGIGIFLFLLLYMIIMIIIKTSIK